MSPLSTSISERAPWARVAGRGLLLLSPLLLLVGALELIFWRAGECWPSSRVVKTLSREPGALYGPRYFDPHIHEIKAELIRRRKPKILALGSSRVTQLRAPMFAPLENQFFNGGLLLASAPEFFSFTKFFLTRRLPAPSVMIVNLDPWWMKQRGAAEKNDRWKKKPSKKTIYYSGAAHLAAMRALFTAGEKPWPLLWPGTPAAGPQGARALGLGALEGNCYRADGSVMQAGVAREYRAAPGFRDREQPPIIERIRRTTKTFTPTKGVDWAMADRMIARLVELQAAGIEVQVFLPPYSIESDTALRAEEKLAGWHIEYFEELPQRLRAAGIPCVAVPSPATYGLTDDYMIDGFHPGDVLMTHVVEDLAKQAPAESVLQQLDRAKLQQMRNAPGVLPVALHPPEE